MSIWYIVESEDSPAQLEKEVGTEGNKGPERDLTISVQARYR